MFDQEQKMKIWKHKTKDKEIYTATTIGRNDKFIHDDIYMTELHYFSDLCLITIVNSGVKIFWCLLSIRGANTISLRLLMSASEKK